MRERKSTNPISKQYVVFPEYLHFSDNPAETLQELILKSAPDQYAILVDEQTREFCLPLLKTNAPIIQIKSGEEEKTMDTCGHIWAEMTRLGFSRKSVMINLGGGVIGDMGGFAAATYKRGIRFVNFPTTLLSMVDASIGGKLGIDFQGLKNHIGVFQEPYAVVVCSQFLNTLPNRQIKSGFAEILKHGLIKSRNYWDEVRGIDLTNQDWNAVIPRSVELKQEVVAADPLEAGLRKILNFGHTLGHAIETHFLGTKEPLLHGEAIAVGMVLEAQLSVQKGLLEEEELREITETIKMHYSLPALPEVDALETLLFQDKKNEEGRLNFALLATIGNCHYDVVVDLDEIRRAMVYYHAIR
jgi:3-dehydroquinate synthase